MQYRLSNNINRIISSCIEIYSLYITSSLQQRLLESEHFQVVGTNRLGPITKCVMRTNTFMSRHMCASIWVWLNPTSICSMVRYLLGDTAGMIKRRCCVKLLLFSVLRFFLVLHSRCAYTTGGSMFVSDFHRGSFTWLSFVYTSNFIGISRSRHRCGRYFRFLLYKGNSSSIITNISTHPHLLIKMNQLFTTREIISW